MKVLWESDEWPGARVDPAVTCLSWIPCKESASGGFLGSGSESGAVGVTRTELSTSASATNGHAEKRFNFNLRGHHSSISLVAWNVAQTKLASCDESGIIYVWVPNEERWSVELVNDRGVKVRDFSWSPSGSSALICYEDNFVLIGSATGQRIWSNSFAQTVLCGVWAHDSREIIIGLNTGSILVLTEQGATVTERTVWVDNAIEQLACSAVRASDGRSTLCVCFAGGQAHFLRSYDDPDPVVFTTELKIVAVQWSGSGEYLALAATSSAEDSSGGKRAQCANQLFLFNGQGVCLQVVAVPVSTDKRLSAFTWAHDDQVVVLAAGGDVAVGRVVLTVPPLFLLSSYRVWGLLGVGNDVVDSLPLPTREKAMVLAHDDHIIQCRIPSPRRLCSSVCHPSCWRWYCTIRPVPRKAQTYMLCMEHMGGLVPVLIGRQINRLLPEFEIRLPKPSPNYRAQSASRSRSRTPDSGGIAAEVEDKTVDSPFQRSNLQRNSVWRRSKRQLRAIVHRAQQHAQGSSSAKYEEKLVQVTSNVWCTRFKVTGMSPTVLPPYLGQVVYKTSVLHLQPRQMTVHVVDLERRSALTAPVAPPLDVDITDSGTDENLLGGQIDGGMPVAPLDGEIFVGVGGPAAGGLVDPLEEAETDELLAEEQALLQHVLAEFGDLRAAVDRHISRMRDFAADLQRSSQQLHNGGARAHSRRPVSVVGQVSGSVSSSSSPRRLSVHSVPANAIDERKVATKLTTAAAAAPAIATWEAAPPTTNRWENQLETLQFIDEDESLVVTSEAERRRLRPRTLSASNGQASSTRLPIASRYGSERTSVAVASSSANEENRPAFSRPTGGTVVVKGPGARQLTEITSVLEKLYKLANELTARPGVSDGGRASAVAHQAPQTGGKVSPHRWRQTPAVQETQADGGTETVAGVTQLRSRIREIAQRVAQLERRINFGNELLDEVRGDLHQRVQHIRAVLGEQQLTMTVTDGGSVDGSTKSNRAVKQQEQAPASDDHNAVLVLQNKTPFWNEQSQVYQLDFGGRVTQESAKNFQIEHQERQVMQFGRIENGAYTLDFRSPFSAVQAFSVALASITQRLK